MKRQYVWITASAVVFALLIVFNYCDRRPNSYTVEPFSPVTEVARYQIEAYHTSADVDTAGMLTVILPDTIHMSWNQPASRRTYEEQPDPGLLEWDYTASATVWNDSSLYRYLYAGNDTSVFTSVNLGYLRPGVWQICVMCVDTAEVESKLSSPFNVFVRKPRVAPNRPQDLWIEWRPRAAWR